MVRTFETHEIRKQKELSGKCWEFIPQEGEHCGQHYSVVVPSCWETYPEFENYRGMASYETTFEAEGNVRIEFKGVSHCGTVFVDGEEIGTHYNAYTPFDVCIKNLEAGIHHLKLEVDNSFKPEYALNRDNDYMSYGGISRGVILEQIPDTYISGLHITPIEQVSGGWKARVEIFCKNIGERKFEGVIEIQLGKTVFQMEKLEVGAGETKAADAVILFDDVKTWSPETPVLYKIKAVLRTGSGQILDDLIERTGFRTLKMSGKRILLNGNPLRIKGFCRHEDHPQYGCALPLEAMAYDLERILDMGGNSVRTTHYPNDELFLDLCDELGILVWEENHARGLRSEEMENPYFEDCAEQVIREMITAHYNHPSVYIWGILNECASHTESGRLCYKKQFDLIRKLDSSRPCSSATCKYEKDICLDLPDVVSWNMYPYWYLDKTASDMIDELYQYTQAAGRGPGKPFMVTEIGAGAIYGFRSPDHDKWTEEYQAEAIEKQLSEVMAYRDCMGLYIWQFCDNRVSGGWFEKRPRTRNNKGIVDEFRRPKLAYETVKKIFSSCSNYWDE